MDGEWQALLDSLSYKPGWEFRVQEGKWDTTLLIHLTDVQDTYSDRRIRVTHRYVLPLRCPPDAGYARRWVRDCIHRTEMHESDEWIRFNGEMVYNPHQSS